MRLSADDDIRCALDTLRRGGVILYPTDTVWGLGCDATRSDAVRRIFDIKRRSDAKALICLIDNADHLERWVEGVPDVAYELIDAAVRPLTVVYDRAYVPPIAPELPAPDGSLAVRVTRHPFTQALCRGLRRPLVSTSANRSGCPTPASFADIDPSLLAEADYVCTTRLDTEGQSRPSTIIRLTESAQVTVIRP